MNGVSYTIRGGDYEHGGAASRSVKEQLKKVGADPAVIRRAMVAAYEAEMNVVIHASRGELRAALHNGQLDIEVTDEGPGMPDVELAMRPGFSTAPAAARELGFGAGMGLPNIKKNVDRFTIESTVGKGTRVSFTILLKPQALYGQGRNSLRIDAGKCQESLRCVHACPAQAMRVFRGKPEVLDYLCIDCTACIAVCPSGALSMLATADSLRPDADAVLVVPAAALAQFGAGVPVRRVCRETQALGFREVLTTEPWEAALREAVVEYARTEAPAFPVISPVCPAVVNLIESRYPSLIPHIAPFLSAIEAVQAQLSAERLNFVVLCPCQRTALLSGESGARPEIASPAALRAAVLPRVAGARDIRPETPGIESRDASAGGALLPVTGLRHVVAVLEDIEDGLAGDLRVIEPWGCDEACFGSPLLATDAFLARRRWASAATVARDQATRVSASALRRSGPISPRKGLRVDSDMTKAIQKLARIDRLTRALPGSNCGMCGAPTCASLAEDIVLGRASADACVRAARSGSAAGLGGTGSSCSTQAGVPRATDQEQST